MKRPLIFVPIETKVREFHGKLLFSLAAVEQGCDVVIAGQQALQRELHTFERGVYLDKSVAITRAKWFRRCRAMGNRVASWDEEGLVYFDADSYLELRAHEEAFGQAELFIAWGNDLKQTLLKKFPDSGDKVVCAGNPRFDLLRPELRGFFQKSVQEIHQRFGERLILINTNFGFCNHFNGVESARKTLTTYPIAQSRPGFFDGWIEAQQVMFDEFKDLIPRLCRDFPDHTIIIRPHPSENRTTWEEFAKDYQNVVVNGEGNVVEWILASKVLLHFNCTTAIEAYLLDIPAIAYKTKDIGDYEQRLPNALSITATSYEEMAEVIDKCCKGEYILTKSPGQEELARHFISSIDGPLAADTIARAIVGVCYENRPKRSLSQLGYVIWRRCWLLLKQLKEHSRQHDQYDRQKFPGIDEQELLATIATFTSISGRFADVQVKPLSEHCYLLTTRR